MLDEALRRNLSHWQAGQLPLHELVKEFREFYKQSALPSKYGDVLESILGRLESASLFTEESCSFSQKDLKDMLESWLEKAQLYLNSQASNQ